MADHICGIYYILDTTQYNPKRYYLPQAELSSHTNISRLFYTTTLHQLFSNPSKDVIKELRYTFPLYDGVSVGGYTITYGDVTLIGKVEQKAEAKHIYEEAVARGETAGLLESLPAGVFGVTIGNLPASTDVHVDITYAGELKHDAGIDGLRYMLPTSIAPRYGSYPGQLLSSNVRGQGLNITVDVDMGRSNIRKIQSHSHPIAVSMGSLSTESASDAFQPSKASATLTQGTTELGSDFVLQLVIDDLASPQAVLETHPSLDSRAIMATLVPKFSLPQASPEIVFIADQSGSMSGSKNIELIAALEVFLRSLPFGVRFNICAFGSNYKYLWATSQAYNESNLREALAWIKKFSASYGGTEMFEPVKQAFLRRHTDLPLEVVLLTDGEIWGESQLFDLINSKIRDEKVNARVFTLGIGADVSHTLVEGVARAGNGFAQFITSNEQIDQKIIRSLKGCLYPHLSDYTLEANFADSIDKDEGEDYEIVEKINHQMQIDDPPAYTDTKDETRGSSTSFFDNNAEKDEPIAQRDGRAGRYAHLPRIQSPAILQAPSSIPPLFPFNRSTLYLLLGPEAPKQNVVSVTLRAKGPTGPLKLTVPVYTQPARSRALHQLAARKAIQDLEEGRGWLHEAVDAKGAAVKQKHSSRFDELVEQEVVRLGTAFDVASKWTSFVAVNKDATGDVLLNRLDETSSQDSRPAGKPAPGQFRQRRVAPRDLDRNDLCSIDGLQSAGSYSRSKKRGGIFAGLFNVSHSAPPPAPPPAPAPAAFGASASFGAPTSLGASLFAPCSASARTHPSPSSAWISHADLPVEALTHSDAMDEDSAEEELERLEAESTGISCSSGVNGRRGEKESGRETKQGTPLRTIIACQHFDGSWSWSTMLANIVTLRDSTARPDDENATVLVLAYLEKHMAGEKIVWEMIAEKARAWLTNKRSMDVDNAIAQAVQQQIQ